jgi:hypothetical protein
MHMTVLAKACGAALPLQTSTYDTATQATGGVILVRDLSSSQSQNKVCMGIERFNRPISLIADELSFDNFIAKHGIVAFNTFKLIRILYWAARIASSQQ